MMSDTLKSPCRGCPDEYRQKKEVPCASCKKPAEYDVALNTQLNSTMAFLRNSSFGKEKKPVEEQAKYSENNKPEAQGVIKNTEPIPEVTEPEKVDPTANGEAKKQKETPKHPCPVCKKIRFEDRDYSQGLSCHLPGQYVWGVKKAKEKKTMENKDDQYREPSDMLKKYCEKEGVLPVDVTSGTRDPAISESRKRIAISMKKDGVDRKVIAMELNVGQTTVWNYLQDNEQQNDGKQVITLNFTGREDIYEKICNIAEERLRKPEDQLLWWLINCDFEKIEKRN